jgi:hypothetical protein
VPEIGIKESLARLIELTAKAERGAAGEASHPKRSAVELRMNVKTLASLPVPFVRVGCGRGKVLYQSEDIETYIRSKIRYYEESPSHGDRVQKRHQKVGLSGLPSRATLQKIRVVNEGRG